MQVESVKDVTTRESAVTYEVKLRVTCWDLEQSNEDRFTNELNGITPYPYFID
jgi:hypothetical protein